jgi:hypothetical protein
MTEAQQRRIEKLVAIFTDLLENRSACIPGRGCVTGIRDMDINGVTFIVETYEGCGSYETTYEFISFETLYKE